jgi:hypothetical protein
MFIVFLIGCTSNKDTQREFAAYTIITDSIYTKMPGVLLKFEKYVVWQDPFGVDGFIHIIDTKTNEEVGVMGKIGQGPNEFNTPSLHRGKGNSIIVFDLNSQKQGIFPIDSLRFDNGYYTSLYKTENHGVTQKIQLNDNSVISLLPDKPQPFVIANKNTRKEFGVLPINEQISNGYNIFQGIIAYNENKKLLVYSSMNFFSLNIYKRRDENNFILKNSVKSNIDYRVVKSELILDKDNQIGPAEMTLTKDYIVTIQRDYEKDKTEESSVGMNFEKLPKTVFLYDYHGNFIKIIDVGIPLLRIAGDIHNNELYAIGLDGEFIMIKFSV